MGWLLIVGLIIYALFLSPATADVAGWEQGKPWKKKQRDKKR